MCIACVKFLLLPQTSHRWSLDTSHVATVIFIWRNLIPGQSNINIRRLFRQWHFELIMLQILNNYKISAMHIQLGIILLDNSLLWSDGPLLLYYQDHFIENTLMISAQIILSLKLVYVVLAETKYCLCSQSPRKNAKYQSSREISNCSCGPILDGPQQT